jgi:hypothetical protein
VWRWFRAPLALPVAGIWWWLVVVVFALARFPSYAYYVLAVMPLPVVLASGAFDGAMPASWARAVSTWRWLYVAALLALTVVTGNWLTSRGGSLDDFGVTFEVQEAQARALLKRERGERPALTHERGEVGNQALTGDCQAVSKEVRWIAEWIEGRSVPALAQFQVCGEWTAEGYRWSIDRRPGIRRNETGGRR